jgi:hypothetical protein
MLKVVKELQINCEGEKNGCCVLNNGDYSESYASP